MVFEKTITVFWRPDHCHQWFSMVFYLATIALLSMVFDGYGPLVKRCDGFDGSLWSSPDRLPLDKIYLPYKAARSAGIGKLDSSIAKDLIGSQDPKHTLFCREIAFASIYALFRDTFPSFDSNSNRFATAAESLEHICF